MVPWKFGDYNHTHNILQKWLAPTIVLNVSLQKQHFPRALFQIWYLFYIYIYIWFFWNIYVFWEKKKKIQTNRKGQMVIIVHFVYRNPVWVSRFHTQKKPLSWQLFSAIRYAALGNPSLGVKWLLFYQGCLHNVVVQQTKYRPSKKKCKLCAEKMECICKPTLLVVGLVVSNVLCIVYDDTGSHLKEQSAKKLK